MNDPRQQDDEGREGFVPCWRSLGAATVAIAATYGYFLIFAQYGFMRIVIEVFGDEPAKWRPVMVTLGLAGMAGSGLMAWGRTRARQLWPAGYGVAGLAAGLAVGARTPAIFFVSAALTGLGTGIVTVGLAGCLRRETGGRWLGRCVGVGTGLAYAWCNIPPVFTASGRTQAGFGLAAAAVGLLATRGFVQRAPFPATTGKDHRPGRVVGWTLGLMVLVVFDSAAFHLIQQDPALKAATWTEPGALWVIAGAHLLAGVLTGLALAGRTMTGIALAGAALLLAATALVFSGHGAPGAPLYAAAVSVYSAGLVFFPARSGRIGVAAGIYIVAGWLGSAVGIILGEILR